jgi:hypothetical protein
MCSGEVCVVSWELVRSFRGQLNVSLGTTPLTNSLEYLADLFSLYSHFYLHPKPLNIFQYLMTER